MKKKKEYIGDIPFDVWGNQLQYLSSYNNPTHDLAAENFINGRVCCERDWKTKRMEELFFQDQQDLKYTPLPTPRHRQHDWDKKGPPTVIATIAAVINKPNYVFSDTLTYSHYEKGRSAVNFIFNRSDNRMVSIFITDFEQMLKKLIDGKITGQFTFCKRGANYGCKLVG